MLRSTKERAYIKITYICLCILHNVCYVNVSYPAQIYPYTIHGCERDEVRTIKKRERGRKGKKDWKEESYEEEEDWRKERKKQKHKEGEKSEG